MTTDLALNIRGLTVNGPQSAAALKLLGSRWALVESNPGLARELAAQGFKVVYRDYWPEQGDDNLHLKVKPAAWFDHMAGLNLPADTIIIAGNEPTRQYPELVDWSLESMDLARARGWRLAVGSFSTGNPSQFDWDDVLLPLLEALQDGWHVLSTHEYITTAFKISTPWHVGRFKYALDACRVHGLKPPRIFITETGLDVTGSWQSLGLSAAAFAGEVGQAVREVWRPAGVEMAALFSLGAWSIEHSGHTWEFDVTPALEELAKIGQEEPMPDLETLYDCTLRVLSDTGSNLRAAPDTSAARVAGLARGEYAAICGDRATEDGWAWAHVTVNGITGWIALEKIDGSMTTLATVTPGEPAPEPTPVPEPQPEPPVEEPPAPVVDGLELMRNLREMLQTCQQAIGVMLEYIEQEMDAA
jgi:hypothetical protein